MLGWVVHLELDLQFEFRGSAGHSPDESDKEADFGEGKDCLEAFDEALPVSEDPPVSHPG